MTRITLFAASGTITTGNNLDVLSLISGDFSNDAILEITFYNDSATDVSIKISTESNTDSNAFELKQNESLKIEMNPDKLYFINDSGATVTYRVLFKLRIVSD